MPSFHDVGAWVYYFELVSWYVPEGSCVGDYAEELLRLRADGPGRGQPLRFSSSRSWLRAIESS